LIQDDLHYKKELVDYNEPNVTRIQLYRRLSELLENCQFSSNQKLKAFQKSSWR